MMTKAAPAHILGPVPIQQAGTVRRAAAMDLSWPEGRLGLARLAGICQDLAAPGGAGPRLIGEARIEAKLSAGKRLISVDANEHGDALASFTGQFAGGAFRQGLRTAFASVDERQGQTFMLLDNLPGAAFVSSWGWYCWDYDTMLQHWLSEGPRRPMENVCAGFVRGAPSLDAMGRPDIANQSSAYVDDLVNPADPDGFPALPGGGEPAFRRARWIDVRLMRGGISVQAGHQDSAATPDGRRRAVHEYRVEALLDAESRIRSIDVTPTILPFASCPAAALNSGRLVGTKIEAIDASVRHSLAREMGCTHLNDLLKDLACVPILAAKLG